MFTMELEVKGLEEMIRFFDEAERSLLDELDAAVDSGAKLVWDMAVTLVPVRTGNLKSTIIIIKEKELERIVRAGGPQAPYAPFVEFGTPRTAARAFMRPALEARRAEIMALIHGAVGRIFGK